MSTSLGYDLLCTQGSYGVEVWKKVSERERAQGHRYPMLLLDGRGPFIPQREAAKLLLARCEIQQPRYVFFVGWSYKISSEVYLRWECVNLHCTDLPYGRGGGPIENLLLRGHTETVMSAHRVTREIDAGPVYGREGPVSLAGSTKEDILRHFIDPCVTLINWIVEHRPTPVPQVGEPVLFKRLPLADYEQFWRDRVAQG